MSAAARNARTIAVLWRRDVLLFVRQRTRVLGAILTPLLFWLALGSGLAPTFRLGEGAVGYREYFFPGTVLMLLLFSAISATMSVIEDRREGFLQGVLAGPGSRAALALGKIFGSATVCLLHALLLVLLAPLAGFPYGSIRWLPLLVVLALTALALAALGFALAWWTGSTQGYHVIMNVVLLPLWVISGSLFPPEGLHRVLGWLVRANPLSYAVTSIRRALSGGVLPAGTGIPGAGRATEMVVVAALAGALVLAACLAAEKKGTG